MLPLKWVIQTRRWFTEFMVPGMTENNSDQIDLINEKLSDLVLHTCSAKAAM